MRKKDMESRLDEWILEEQMDEKADSTLWHYKHVASLFLDNVPEEISKRDIVAFKSYLITNFRPKTVNNYIVIVNKFIKFCQYMDSDPETIDLKAVKGYKTKDTLKNVKLQNRSSLEEVLEPADLKRMLRMAKKNGDMAMYYIMKILAYTGIRIEELNVFTFENLKTNYIQVSNKGKTRNIILRQDLRRELLKYCRLNRITSGYLFPGKVPGKMLHKTTIWRRMKKIAGQCRGISLSKVHAHSFRHLFSIQFLKQGGNIAELADILGHDSIETTRIYLKTTDKMKRERIESLKY